MRDAMRWLTGVWMRLMHDHNSHVIITHHSSVIIVIVIVNTIAPHSSVNIDFGIIGSHHSCVINRPVVIISRSEGSGPPSLMPMRWHLDEVVLS